MKKSIAILTALLAVSLLSHSVQAGERDIKSTGGAFAGKFRFTEINPNAALLEVEREGRSLRKVEAGYVGNQIYRENWKFDNSWLGYDKLPSGSHYGGGVINEKDAPKVIFGSKNVKNYDILRTEKRSRNLIIITYRNPRTDEKCVGLVYTDEEIYSEGYGGSYGDYTARSIACEPKGGDHKQALALSAHYLSLVKKDGRPIARLSRYNLPKPSEQALAPRPSPAPRPIVKHAVEPGASDARVCAMSTNFGYWVAWRSFQDWVEEAHKRNLSLDDCEKLRGANSAFSRAPVKRVCDMATENGAWQQRRPLKKWVIEARKRGLSLEDCDRVLKAI